MAFVDKIEKKRQEIANSVIQSFENDTKWSKGWYSISSNPHNAKTGNAYNGTNFLILLVQAAQKGYSDSRWLTFNQAQDLNASIKAGEKATSVFHYNEYDTLTKKPPNWSELHKLPADELREYEKENIKYSISYHSVFNAEQTINLPTPVLSTMSADELTKQNELIELIITNSNAKFIYGVGGAFYSPEQDTIRLPQIENFKSKQDYYATALHEIVHSTGHSSRLNRLGNKPTEQDYAIEELRAEFASMFLQSELGINLEGNHFENHTAYIKHWVRAVKDDRNILFKTISEAGDIASYVKDNYAVAAKEKDKQAEILQGNTISKASQLWQNYSKVKAENPDAIVMYRVGDFYEMFGDDALLAAVELDLTLTHRDVGLAERVSMCGIPFHTAETYIKILIEHEYKVAVCETPGTINLISKSEMHKSILDDSDYSDYESSIEDWERHAYKEWSYDELSPEEKKAYDEKQATFNKELKLQEIETALKSKITFERLEEIEYDYKNETNDEETQMWRDYLSSDEESLVQIWDNSYAESIAKIEYDIAMAVGENMFRQNSYITSDEQQRFLKEADYKDFLKQGGGLSGVYDISDKNTRAYVEKYAKYIYYGHVFNRDSNNKLQPVFLESILKETKNATSDIKSDVLINSNGGNSRKGAKMNSNITVIGKVVKGYEKTEFESGSAVGKFSVVVPSGKKDEQGKGVGDSFYNIETWNKSEQDTWSKRVNTGELVAVRGNLEVQTYERADGVKGTSLNIKNADATFLGKSGDAGMATVSIIGNLTRDPDVHTFDSGKTKASLTVAVNDANSKDENTKANYYDVELWNERAGAANYLHKGSKVGVYGDLRCEGYETKDGKIGTSIKIVNPQMNFLDKKQDNTSIFEPKSAKKQQKASSEQK